ncbi:MAG: hypothetical protein KDD82_02305 [Planctomycetes bacterium]|nr:hypothetical protein [Planctomycetota bacterium]
MTKKNAQDLLTLGDTFRQNGQLKNAAACYVRCADQWLAEKLFGQAKACLSSDPVQALNALSKAERLVGATGEGRTLSARAYQALGQVEIAQRFLAAAS